MLCWFFSIVGVGASFLIFGPSISGYQLWGISLCRQALEIPDSPGAKEIATMRGGFARGAAA
jgi:hypothetical protein